MRKTIIYLFIACFFAGIGKTSYAQSYKNDIDIGKGAFSILQKMDTMTEDEFISIFSNTIHLYNSLSSEKNN